MAGKICCGYVVHCRDGVWVFTGGVQLVARFFSKVPFLSGAYFYPFSFCVLDTYQRVQTVLSFTDFYFKTHSRYAANRRERDDGTGQKTASAHDQRQSFPQPRFKP